VRDCNAGLRRAKAQAISDLLILKIVVLRFCTDDMKATLIAPLILAASLLSAPHARALTVPETPPSAWNKGSFGVQTNSEYFFSHANYAESRGSFDKLVNDNKWTSFENRLKLRFGLTNWVSLYAGLGATASTATNLGVTKNNSGVNEVYAGVDFLLARRWWRVVPELEASYPADETTRLQTNPLTSDGVPYANLGVFLFKPYRYLRFEGYLGFHIPGEQLASRFMYNLGTEVAMFGAFTVGAAVQGYESVLADGTSNNERKLTQATADATSERFWAYNPALLEAKAWIGLRFDRSFGVRLGYAKTLNGVRTAEGQSVLLALYYNTPGLGPKRNSSRINVGPAPVVPRGEQDFKTVPEPNDPELFDQRQNPDSSLDNTERLFDRKSGDE
jgi:hypothetical protein